MVLEKDRRNEAGRLCVSSGDVSRRVDEVRSILTTIPCRKAKRKIPITLRRPGELGVNLKRLGKKNRVDTERGSERNRRR